MEWEQGTLISKLRKSCIMSQHSQWRQHRDKLLTLISLLWYKVILSYVIFPHSWKIKDVLHRYPRSARKQWCRHISLFVWLRHTWMNNRLLSIWGLDGLKVPLLVCTNHINNEKHVHHGFLAPRPYLCSTSLSNLFWPWFILIEECYKFCFILNQEFIIYRELTAWNSLISACKVITSKCNFWNAPISRFFLRVSHPANCK